jgi:hypothetical protein
MRLLDEFSVGVTLIQCLNINIQIEVWKIMQDLRFTSLHISSVSSYYTFVNGFEEVE